MHPVPSICIPGVPQIPKESMTPSSGALLRDLLEALLRAQALGGVLHVEVVVLLVHEVPDLLQQRHLSVPGNPAGGWPRPAQTAQTVGAANDDFPSRSALASRNVQCLSESSKTKGSLSSPPSRRKNISIGITSRLGSRLGPPVPCPLRTWEGMKNARGTFARGSCL